jgi:hypothetical protein
VRVAVRVTRAGRVFVKGVASISGDRVTVFAGSRMARRPGTVKVPISLSKAARRRLAKAGSLRIRMVVSLAGAPKAVVRSMVLERAKRPSARFRRSA